MQINRLFDMIYLLLDKKSVTAKELAERFEVSVRTIYRDIDTLSSAGIPIYANPGKGGGISLLEEYILNKSVLSEQEQNEILFALQSLTAAQTPETDRVLAKLSSLFNKHNANWIEVDFSPWGSRKHQPSEFSILKNAILHRQVIEFDYFSSAGEKTGRRVEPVTLVFKVNAWYLRGFCLSRMAARTFKISRMSSVRATPEHFSERPEREEAIPEPSTQKWMKVELHISSGGAYRVYDEFYEKDVMPNQDGSFTVHTSLPDSKWLIGYLLSFGADIRVLSPMQLQTRIREQAEKILAEYGPGER